MTTLRRPTALRRPTPLPAAADFLAQRRIVVAGVSRDPSQPANLIYRRLREAGYEVYPVNPVAREAEGDPCYPDLAALPVRVDGVVAVTPPAATEALATACADLGIPRLWMHGGMGAGSVSEAAVETCRRRGVAAIPGACPMMYLEPVDLGHRCLRGIKRLTGALPRPV
jgi:uncharacterized protein